MAEVKNSFLASKMNKDLDDRLIPSNEYKDALNVAVSNSEDSDVGALENILQNTNVYPISEEANIGNNDGKIIGRVVDPANDNIYLFYTNYTDTSPDGLSNHQASSSGINTYSAIVRYNPVFSGSSTLMVNGKFLNFSETSPIHGINIVEDFLFWTDNRNQPRKINTRTANADRFHYTSEDNVSVAKYAPYTPIDLYKSYSGTHKTTMKDVSSQYLPDGTTANPDYNANYAGDSNYLEDKFVRFSYRIKYEDGEYSIMAPFTQIAFIPKQDGSFLAGDENLAFKSTIVAFMENKVDQISLVINLPDTANNLKENYKIKEIDILYKESDKIAISVLDTIGISEIEAQSLATNVYEYSYQSRKPVKTLPQNQSTRVYDKTPVRALAQEVSGNRVIYGNFVNKHTAPAHLDYQVTVNQKFSSGSSDDNWSYIEYPEHTIKRNRNYQVGWVLSDRYGRQSDVILSNVVDNDSSNGNFGASTFYVPYRASSTSPTTFLADVGNSIKIQLNETINSIRSPLTPDSSIATGEPGLYDATTNPTGWYSYKIVVKQTQQEYYNVYLPGFLKGDLSTGPTTATHSILIGDNINKVPRDLQEVGPNQTKYRSSETLFPIVENYHSSTENWNQPFFPGSNKFNVTTVAPLGNINDLGGATSSTVIFESEEDPLVMRIGNNNGGLGALAQHMIPTLSVAETAPFISNLEIYYETSTSGLISELNTKVITDIGTPVLGFSTFDYNHNENQNWAGTGTTTGAANSPYVTSELIPVDNVNNLLTNTQFISLTVLDNIGQDRTSQFEMIATGSASNGFRLKLKDVTSQFYYGPDALTKESYSFTIKMRNLNDNTTATLDSNVTSSNQITVTVTAGNAPFVGQTISGVGIPNATVTFVDGANVTLNTAITQTAGFVFNFSAPVNTLVKNGSLSNAPPIIDSITYVTPSYSTMQGLYATLVAYNGTFKISDRLLNIGYVWSTLQPQLFGGYGQFTFGNVGSTSLITINNPSGGQVTLALAQNGQVSIFAGAFDFLSTFTLKATITDAGGLTVEAAIVFNDVIPGAFTNAFSTAFDI
tara:strand:- start:74 stop:3244 length:3171 start_codon:yes stop_codon:yes gene_type:complete